MGSGHINQWATIVTPVRQQLHRIIRPAIPLSIISTTWTCSLRSTRQLARKLCPPAGAARSSASTALRRPGRRSGNIRAWAGTVATTPHPIRLIWPCWWTTSPRYIPAYGRSSVRLDARDFQKFLMPQERFPHRSRRGSS